MRAAVVETSRTAPAVMEFPEPQPAAGSKLRHLVGAGVHRVVRSLADGTHYGSSASYPAVLGVDAVARTDEGRLLYVAGPQPPWGTMSERLAAQIEFPLPEGADPLAVAAGVNPGMSGWMPLHESRREVGLGTVVVIGATGVSGGMAVQAAISMGAEKVVAAGRNLASLDRLRVAGAVPAPLPEKPEVLARQIGNPERLLVLDYLWGPPAEMIMAALARNGLQEDHTDISYVQIGSLAGDDAVVPASLLRSRRLRIRGSGAGSASFKEVVEQIPLVLDAIAGGVLDSQYAAYSLSRFDEAWNHTGPERVVITPDIA